MKALQVRRNVAKLSQPVDRTEWFMTPQTVNGLFAPSQNSITFTPARRLRSLIWTVNAGSTMCISTWRVTSSVT